MFQNNYKQCEIKFMFTNKILCYKYFEIAKYNIII